MTCPPRSGTAGGATRPERLPAPAHELPRAQGRGRAAYRRGRLGAQRLAHHEDRPGAGSGRSREPVEDHAEAWNQPRVAACPLPHVATVDRVSTRTPPPSRAPPTDCADG